LVIASADALPWLGPRPERPSMQAVEDAPEPLVGASVLPPANDADTNLAQAEAAISQVEGDLRRMETFAGDVRRNLEEQDRVKQDIAHTLGYFRQQQDLSQDERDSCNAHLQRVEAEVSTLQRRIKELEADKAGLTSDKATLEEANRKVIAQVNSIFQYGQAVQTGLAFQGLATANASDAE